MTKSIILFFILSLLFYSCEEAHPDDKDKVALHYVDTTVVVDTTQLSAAGLGTIDTVGDGDVVSKLPSYDPYDALKTKTNEYPELLIGKWKFDEIWLDDETVPESYNIPKMDLEFRKHGVYKAGNAELGWGTDKYKLDGRRLTLGLETEILVLDKSRLIITYPFSIGSERGIIKMSYLRQ